ncbi:MAG: hypothetical protein WCK17_19315, partial [Verrucomicrobiota bacterium]
ALMRIAATIPPPRPGSRGKEQESKQARAPVDASSPVSAPMAPGRPPGPSGQTQAKTHPQERGLAPILAPSLGSQGAVAGSWPRFAPVQDPTAVQDPAALATIKGTVRDFTRRFPLPH